MPAKAARILLDCDPGADDAIAIMLAVSSPELALRGITASYGNAPAHRTAQNARGILRLCAAGEVPVFEGAAQPLVRSLRFDGGYCGENGICDIVLPSESHETIGKDATGFLIREAMLGGLTIVATAPLTNLALALRQEPHISKNIERIIMTVGDFGVARDAVLPPRAEWNFAVDPEAAKVVFESGIPIVALGLDVSTRLNDDMVRRLTSRWNLKNTATRFFLEASAFYAKRGLTPYSLLVDALAVACAANPSLACTVRGRVEIEADGSNGGDFLRFTQSDSGAVSAACSFDFISYIDMLRERLFL